MCYCTMFGLKSLLLLFLAAILVGEGGLGVCVIARNVLIFLLKFTLCTSHIYTFSAFRPGHCAYILIFHVKHYE